MTMIKCQECIDFLMAYIDGELPAGLRTKFDEHLRLCPPCVRYLETYKQTVKMAAESHRGPGAAPIQELPEALVMAIMATVKASRDDGAGSGCDCGDGH